MTHTSTPLKVATSVRNQCGIVCPSARAAGQVDPTPLDRAITELFESGCTTIILSLEDLAVDHVVLVGLLVLCHQRVKERRARLVLLRERNAPPGSLDEICFFLGIKVLPKTRAHGSGPTASGVTTPRRRKLRRLEAATAPSRNPVQVAAPVVS